MRIETSGELPREPIRQGSPVSDDGCGLKPDNGAAGQAVADGSPVSYDGCGLKRRTGCQMRQGPWDRPSVMTGAD